MADDCQRSHASTAVTVSECSALQACVNAAKKRVARDCAIGAALRAALYFTIHSSSTSLVGVREVFMAGAPHLPRFDYFLE